MADFDKEKTNTEQSKDIFPPPDGGMLAWSQVLAGHLINTVTWGYATGFGVFQTYYEQTLPFSASAISWIGGIQIFLCFAIGTVSGRGTDAGLARPIVLCGSILLVLGTFMTSLCAQYWQVFLAQGVCVGLGLGLVWLPSVTLIATYFKRKRVLAVTMSAAGASTGSMIFPAIIQYLTPQIGFPWAVRVMGFVVLVIAMTYNSLLRTRLPARKSGPLVEWGAFKEPAYLLFTAGVFFLYWAIYFPFFYVQLFAHDSLGYTNEKAVTLIIVMNAVGLPARPMLGYIADRYFGPLNCLIPSILICSILMYSWQAVSGATGLYIFAVFYGLFAAFALSLFVGTVPSLTKDLSKIGTRVGMLLTLMSFAPLTGQSVAGTLIDRGKGRYIYAQVWGGTSLMLGVACCIGARLYISGWKWNHKM